MRSDEAKGAGWPVKLVKFPKSPESEAAKAAGGDNKAGKKKKKKKRKTKKMPYLHEGVSRKEAEERVAAHDTANGTFLVRKSGDKHALHVMYKDKATQHLINKTEAGGFLVNKKSYGDFANLDEVCAKFPPSQHKVVRVSLCKLWPHACNALSL